MEKSLIIKELELAKKTADQAGKFLLKKNLTIN